MTAERLTRRAVLGGAALAFGAAAFRRNVGPATEGAAVVV